MIYHAYFIGGPLDLTKTAVRRAERAFYCLDRPVLNLADVTEQTLDDLNRHEYRLYGDARAYGELNNPALMYVYVGRKA